MPSSHLVRVVDKEWMEAMEQSNADLFLCAFERLIPSTVDGVKVKELKNNSIYPITLPPLRLRTPRGGELEIDSTFQKQLRVAKLCHLLGLPQVLTDWRFPKTQVPSRPDFSRSTAPHYRHTGRPGQIRPAKQLLPAIMTPSKYHVKSLQNLEDLQDLRSDNIPSYVAAYLESSPRDPLAAEECSRRAASMANEAAPKKIYLPIVIQASVHDKLLQPVEVRHPPHEYPQWCFGCRLEHGIQTRETHQSYDVYMCQNPHCRFASWQGLPVLFGPFRDKPVRVGGGFAYTDRENLEPGHTASQNKGEGHKESNVDRKHGKEFKPGELPKMYHPGFIPFKPKTQPKENFRQKRLPVISERDGIPLDEEELKALLGEKTTESMQVEIEFFTPAGGAVTSPVNDNPSFTDQIQSSSTNQVGVLTRSMGAITDKALFQQMEHRFGQFPSAIISSSTPVVASESQPENVNTSDDGAQQKSASVVADVTNSDSVDYGGETAREEDEINIDTPHISCTIHRKVDNAEEAEHAVGEVSFGTTGTDTEEFGVTRTESVNNLSMSEGNGSAEVPTDGNPSSSVSDLTTVLQQTVVVTPYKSTDTNNLTQTVTADVPVQLLSTQLDNDPLAKVREPGSLVSKKKSNDVLSEATRTDQSSTEITQEENCESDTPSADSPEAQVIYSPLLGEKSEFRWVVKPLEVLEYEGEFVDPEVLPQVMEQQAEEVVYLDDFWCAMEGNVVSSELVLSKEFVPIWSITRDILHDVLEDVMRKIAKKKAPPKKVKGEIVKKPARKIKEVKLKMPSPPPQPLTPPPKTPSPSPPPPPAALPSREPTPPKRKQQTPPRQVAPSKPLTPPPKKVLELPPLPQSSNIVAQPKTAKPTKVKPQASKFGASLVSRAEVTHNRRYCKPRSPSSTSVTSVTPEASKHQARVLDVKVLPEIEENPPRPLLSHHLPLLQQHSRDCASFPQTSPKW